MVFRMDNIGFHEGLNAFDRTGALFTIDKGQDTPLRINIYDETGIHKAGAVGIRKGIIQLPDAPGKTSVEFILVKERDHMQPAVTGCNIEDLGAGNGQGLIITDKGKGFGILIFRYAGKCLHQILMETKTKDVGVGGQDHIRYLGMIV